MAKNFTSFYKSFNFLLLTVFLFKYSAESEISTDSEFDPAIETLSDRLYALRDIISPTTRAYIGGKVGTCTNTAVSALTFTGRTLWLVATSALILAVPYNLALMEDQILAVSEQEMKMREMGGELLTAGSGDGSVSRSVPGPIDRDSASAAQASMILGESGKEGKATL